MFSKVLLKIREYYFLPVVFLTPAKALTQAYEEYVRYKKQPDVSMIQHTFCCLMGVWSGAVAGAFLGATWPISFPIFIGRCIDKK